MFRIRAHSESISSRRRAQSARGVPTLCRTRQGARHKCSAGSYALTSNVVISRIYGRHPTVTAARL